MPHPNSDYITDLNDLVRRVGFLLLKQCWISFFSPVGLKKVIDGIVSMLTIDQKYFHYHHADLLNGPRLQVAVHKVSSGVKFSIGCVRVIVGRPDHQPVTPTIGFRIEAEVNQLCSLATFWNATNSMTYVDARIFMCRRFCVPI